MRIKFIQNVSAIAGSFHRGQEVDVDDAFAADMLQAKYAEEVDPVEMTLKSHDGETIATVERGKGKEVKPVKPKAETKAEAK